MRLNGRFGRFGGCYVPEILVPALDQLEGAFLDAQREVWFSRGPLFDAIRASIAIPTVFRPHHYQGRLLVDGGLLNPLPISPTLRDLTDATIAVDVNAPAEALAGLRDDDRGTAGQASPEHLPGDPRPGDLARAGQRRRFAAFVDSFIERRERRSGLQEPGALELFARSLDIVQETITRLKLAAQPPDLLVTIPRKACAVYEFHRAEERIEIGRRRTRAALARWAPTRSSR